MKAAVPFGVRRSIAHTRLKLRLPTGGLRMTPDFLVIGTQRGGTSSLFQYLARHPDVARSVRKEVDYFSVDYLQGWNWYLAHFPLRLRQTIHRLVLRSRLQTFEATPDYVLMPHSAERVAKDLPSAKIIVLLRDPIERTFSGYKHMMRYGHEQRSFADALAAEPELLESELPKIEADPDYDAIPYRRWAYAHRGCYADQLTPWIERFDADRLLIVESEELFEDEARTYAKVLDFLELRQWVPAEFRNHSNLAPVPTPAKIDLEVRTQLEDYFRPHNKRLETLVGRTFRWS